MKTHQSGPGEQDKSVPNGRGGTSVRLDPDGLREMRDKVLAATGLGAGDGRIHIVVGMGTSGIAAGAGETIEEFRREVSAQKLGDVVVHQAGSMGLDHAEPTAEIRMPGMPTTIYGRVTPEIARKIVRKHILGRSLINDHIYDRPAVDIVAAGQAPQPDAGGGREGVGETQSHIILVCGGERCTKHGSKAEGGDADAIFRGLVQSAEESGIRDQLQVVKSGCFGFCDMGPVVKVLPDTLYTGVTPADTAEIIHEHIVGGRPAERLRYDPAESRKFADVGLEFYQKQFRIVLRNCGIIDPEQVDEYIARDGYSALATVLFDMSAQQVIEELKTAGLRGRGGAGFPTWMKWNFSREAESEQKYVVCNADEGDPGAYMDRSVLEGDPHSVLESMAICGRTIGADKGYIYVRAEYPLAISRLEKAIEQATRLGLLGDKILGSDFSFDVEIRLGAGAFVCGEETALIASIEGGRGMPRPRPPFPSVKGLWGKPTVINNVETWANVPVIINRGGAWFAKIGTGKSKGTKVFALTGKIVNSGLVEVPMGTTLRDMVFNIGGGIPDARKFKAVQTGGPSGGVVTEAHLDTPIDYEHLQELGSIMGSGGMIVTDETDCMVDVARFYLGFTVEESCGKCAPCRIGGRKLLNILTRITEGKGSENEIEAVERISRAMQKASLCGLGQSAPNPIVSTLRYFREEYEAHIADHRCPAGVCKELLHFSILPGKCIGCGLCARRCPADCISGSRREPHEIDQERCIKCGECFAACKFDAVLRA